MPEIRKEIRDAVESFEEYDKCCEHVCKADGFIAKYMKQGLEYQKEYRLSEYKKLLTDRLVKYNNLCSEDEAGEVWEKYCELLSIEDAKITALKGKYNNDIYDVLSYNNKLYRSKIKKEIDIYNEDYINKIEEKLKIIKGDMELYKNSFEKYLRAAEFVRNNINGELKNRISDYIPGHCYFLPLQTEYGIPLADHHMKYRIIPLLEQYVKDGILTCGISAVKELEKANETAYTTDYSAFKLTDMKIDIHDSTSVDAPYYEYFDDIIRKNILRYGFDPLISRYQLFSDVFTNTGVVSCGDGNGFVRGLFCEKGNSGKLEWDTGDGDRTSSMYSEKYHEYKFNGIPYFLITGGYCVGKEIAVKLENIRSPQSQNCSPMDRMKFFPILCRTVICFYEAYIKSLDGYYNASFNTLKDNEKKNLELLKKFTEFELNYFIDSLLGNRIFDEIKNEIFDLRIIDPYNKSIDTGKVDLEHLKVLPKVEINDLKHSLCQTIDSYNNLKNNEKKDLKDKINEFIDSHKEKNAENCLFNKIKYIIPELRIFNSSPGNTITDNNENTITVIGVYKTMNTDYKKIMEDLSINQMILQGPPGTSKTYGAKEFILEQIRNVDPQINDIEDYRINNYDPDSSTHCPYDDNMKNNGDKSRSSIYWDIVQFHPSYSYEDFVRGIEVSTVSDDSGNHQIQYNTVNKILGKMAALAQADKEDSDFYLIIDEINRADLAGVFGELIYALEYRGEGVNTPYTINSANGTRSSEIVIPKNMYIIGTMNTADKSIGSIDYAIRRRFLFFPLLPDADVVKKNTGKIVQNFNNNNANAENFATVKLFLEVEKIFQEGLELNRQPVKCLNDDYYPDDVQIGHTYFLVKPDKNQQTKISEEKQLNELMKNRLQYQIVPIIREYIKDGILNDIPDIEAWNFDSKKITEITGENIYYLAVKNNMKLFDNIQT